MVESSSAASVACNGDDKQFRLETVDIVIGEIMVDVNADVVEHDESRHLVNIA